MDSQVRGAPSAAATRPEGPPRTTRRLAVPVVLIVVLGLVAAIAASRIVAQANVDERQQALNAHADAIATAFEERINQAVRTLRTAKGLLTVDPEPTNERFQTFLRSAIRTTPGNDGELRYDGFDGIRFIRWVRAADTEAFIERMRREGFGETFNRTPTGTDSYVFVLHSSRGSSMLGTDVRPVATRREALHRARDSGRAAVTEWVVALSERGVDPARADQTVVVFLPVYRTLGAPGTVAARRAALVGWMSTGIRASDLFAHAMPDGSHGYDIALYDGAPSAHTLVRSTAASDAPAGSVSVRKEIAVGDDTWTLVVSGQEAVSTAVRTTRNPAVVFVLVTLLSALIAVLVAVVGRQRRQIQQQVIEVTAQLRHSEQRLRRMADAVPVGIFDVDRESGETFVNQAFRTLTSGDWAAWASQTYQELQRDVLAAVASDAVFSRRIEIRDGGEAQTWLEVTVAGERDLEGNVTRLFGSLVDVTADVTVEARLSEARDAALANARMKSEFLANMSHEIRTPLNGVIGLATLMLDDDLSQNQKERLVTLREAGQDLLVLLNDILDFSKLEAGRLHLENVPFSPRTVIEQVVALYASTAHDKGLTLRTTVDPALGPVTGDPARLRQVLQNLVGNALKFTAEGEVEITAELLEQDREHRLVRITVRDTGIGISSDARQQIFQVFHQADTSTTRLYGGSGLGLAICQQILDLMGSTLDLESTPGEGSTFSFTVQLGVASDVAEPATPGTQHVTDPADRDSRPWSGATLLVVEDNKMNRQVALSMLAKLGYSAEVARDGIEALDALRWARYDVVLMDCQMPRLDGYETTAHIRALAGDMGRVPIIAMTASAMVGDRERCIAAGMDDYVSKPIDIDVLADAISRALNAGRRTEEPPAPRDVGASPLDPAAIGLLEQLPSDDGSVFENVGGIFLRTSATEIDDARAAADAEDWDHLAYVIHQLGGAASIIGATSLVQRCHDLKICIADLLGPQRIRAALRDVEAEVDRVRAALEVQMPDSAHPAR